MTQANFDKIQAAVDTEVQAAYDRGVKAALWHFDRLHSWLMADMMNIGEVQRWSEQEVKYIAERYPRLTRPSNWAV